MQQHFRRATALLAATALAAGALVAGAGTATATLGANPLNVNGFGINYGYELTWQAPGSTTQPLSYTARLYDGSDTGLTTIKQNKSIPAGKYDPAENYVDFTGLVAGQSYQATVAAVYAGGAETSALAGPVATARKPLNAVTSVKFTPGNRKITVSWKAPTPDALTGPIVGYLLTAVNKQSTEGSLTDRPAFASKGVLTGLRNGVDYLVTVQAYTTDGGAETRKHVTPVSKPAKPKSLTVSWKSGGKAKLTWKAPKSTKASPVTGYVVYVNGKKVKTLKGKSSTSYTVKGQKHGKKYTLSVRARNEGFTSPALTKKLTRP